jgi:hypothetical protein
VKEEVLYRCYEKVCEGFGSGNDSLKDENFSDGGNNHHRVVSKVDCRHGVGASLEKWRESECAGRSR